MDLSIKNILLAGIDTIAHTYENKSVLEDIKDRLENLDEKI